MRKMKSDYSAGSWLKFFLAAGIPKDSAETYAVTFSKNQIQLDMLPEIKKEYLNDMGITLLGHIIAILRHAKTVHIETVTKTTLSSSLESKQPSSTAKPVQKTTPIVLLQKEKSQAVTSSQTERLEISTPVKVVTTPSVDSSSKKIVKPKQTAPKTTPTSTTSESVGKKRKIEAESPKFESKKPVFLRLGEEVTSKVETPTSSNGESVFARLGNKTARPSPSPPASLPVKKIVLTPTVKAEVATKAKAPILRTPKVQLANNTLQKKITLLNQGLPAKTMRADQDTPVRIISSTLLSAEHTSYSMKNKTSPSSTIHLRLGTTSPATSVTPSLFDLDSSGGSLTPNKTKHVTFGKVTKRTIPRVTTGTNGSRVLRSSSVGAGFRGQAAAYRSVNVSNVFSRLQL